MVWWMQVGGLGDVVTGLSRACLMRGHHVVVVLPFYSSMPQDRIKDLTFDRDFHVPKVHPQVVIEITIFQVSRRHVAQSPCEYRLHGHGQLEVGVYCCTLASCVHLFLSER